MPAPVAMLRAAARCSIAATLIALAAGIPLLGHTGFSPVAAWIVTVAVLGAVTGLLVLLSRRLEREVAALAGDSRRDRLTGLLNRRGFDEAFDIELERARRTEQPLAVIVGALDGHAAGDDTLRRVGETIVASKRSWDGAARVGEDELALVAPDTDEHGAYVLAERIRAAVERSFAGGPEPTTMSFGLVSYPIHGQTAATLLAAAGEALRAAGRLGSNRTVISSAEVPGILARPGAEHDDSPVELGVLLSLAEALDVRDSGSASHCRRVGRYSELIARELGLAPDSVERIRIAGVLHDVGRVGLPDEVLAKNGPLSDEEWQWVRSHPSIGARMLQTTAFADIGAWIGAHHERPDGTGYPSGVTGDALPLEAAILGVADAYEAMTSPRPYREPMEPEVASEELRRGAGRQFEEHVVDALLRVV